MRPGQRRRRAGILRAREQEIAQLIAAGSTDPEIAATLYLSPRTIERHVGNILTKLGYRSRVQIATEAAAGRLPGNHHPLVEPATTGPPPLAAEQGLAQTDVRLLERLRSTLTDHVAERPAGADQAR